MSEKTEQPTPKRLRDARKKGQVAKSREVTSAVVIIGLFLYLWIGFNYILGHLKQMVLFPTNFYGSAFKNALGLVFEGTIREMLLIIIPIVGFALVLAVMSNFFQIGFLFSFEPVKPDLKKINPAEGVKRIFSMNNLIELLKSIIKIGFLGFLIYKIIKDAIDPLLKMPYLGIGGVLMLLSSILKKIVVFSSGAFSVVAAADYFWQKKQYIKKLMMTKEEVKQEYKEMEGDPLIKSKRRQLHRELVMNDTLQRTRKATVIITNPTKRAIALYYEKGKTKLPIVLAKGENLLAKRMIEIAQEEGIPVVQNVPLAQALYEHVNIDQYIPGDLIKPVAEVLRWVQQLKESKGR
jgi:type III secretion protein U